ncbi:hypothetical protein ACFU3E_04235 [Streptomyces sp. NPDC057424]|uniref:hypothetical protein n=1 Tax=Streptomyces sp. NPDC057424 TaxID=3346127 RepID=UPI0036BBFD21
MRELLAPLVVMLVLAGYSFLIFRINRKKESKLATELIVGMMEVRSLGSSKALSLIALASQGVIDCTQRARTFVSLMPDMGNPARPHAHALYYKHRLDIRDIRKDWVDASNSLASHFPVVENAWHDWAVAYSDMTELDPEAGQEEALAMLGELMAAKRRFVSVLSEVTSLIFFLES